MIERFVAEGSLLISTCAGTRGPEGRRAEGPWSGGAVAWVGGSGPACALWLPLARPGGLSSPEEKELPLLQQTVGWGMKEDGK